MDGFLGTAHTMALFFRYCLRYKVTGYKDKMVVLQRIAKKGRLKHIQDVSTLVEGKKILIVQKGDNHHDN